MDGKEPGKTVEWPFNRVEESHKKTFGWELLRIISAHRFTA